MLTTCLLYLSIDLKSLVRNFLRLVDISPRIPLMNSVNDICPDPSSSNSKNKALISCAAAARLHRWQA